ncbi:MAG: DUF2975 domain-containing protein [Clostridiales bacterium]|nr:DUF2975 domain-containing protein [Clostridiales bacterium]MDO4350723.1 DUF2975 domain-containing protein [Eubacteriales bacterium]MDY4008443.1 DUF2975 domain-containing protein [Candidatus Limiplasma sp.]
MKRTLCGRILQAGVIGTALAVLVIAGRFLPMYMRHIADVRPELSGWYGWGILLGWVLALPVLYALVQLWRIFATLAGKEVFSLTNAGRFARIWKLAALDTGLVAIIGLALLVSQTMPPFLMITVSMLLFLGTLCCAVCFALSGLVRSAALMREENDMTV